MFPASANSQASADEPADSEVDDAGATELAKETPPAVSLAPPKGANRAVRDAWLGDRIRALIAERPALARARIGIYVQDVESSRVVYAQNAEERYSVASNAKIITAAAALAMLGPGFRYRTSVLAKAIDANGVVNGDLYLRGRGDPDFGTEDLVRLADDVALAGIQTVRKNIIIDDQYFGSETLPPHFDEQPDEQAAFRPAVSALSLNFNSFAVVVTPALSGHGRALVTIDPPNDYIRIKKNELITQPSGRNRILLTSKVVQGHMEVEIRGQIRADSGVTRLRRRVEDPALYVGAVFRALLAQRGIRVQGKKIKRGATPLEARVVAVIESEPLALLVHGLGKQSNNFVAEVLLKTLGAESRAADARDPLTWEHGLAVVRSFLTNDMGLPEGSFRYGNGSGLFDATELSPVQLVRVLTQAHRDPRYGPDFSSSLSIAGEDGTLRHRMHGSAARGHVRGKTGTLATVSSLCGYAAVDGMRPLAFAIAINGMPATGQAKRDARTLQDGIADALVAYLKSAP